MSQATKPSIGQHLKREAEEYGITFLYLFVCLSAILLYRDALLKEDGLALTPFSFAVIKAMLLAKFMMLGEAMHLGEHRRLRVRILAVAVAIKATLFLLLLVAMSVVEEAIMGVIHGRGLAVSVQELAVGRSYEILANCLLLWLVLVPYFVMRLLGEVIGAAEIRRIFFQPR